MFYIYTFTFLHHQMFGIRYSLESAQLKDDFFLNVGRFDLVFCFFSFTLPFSWSLFLSLLCVLCITSVACSIKLFCSSMLTSSLSLCLLFFCSLLQLTSKSHFQSQGGKEAKTVMDSTKNLKSAWLRPLIVQVRRTVVNILDAFPTLPTDRIYLSDVLTLLLWEYRIFLIRLLRDLALLTISLWSLLLCSLSYINYLNGLNWDFFSLQFLCFLLSLTSLEDLWSGEQQFQGTSLWGKG